MPQIDKKIIMITDSEDDFNEKKKAVYALSFVINLIILLVFALITNGDGPEFNFFHKFYLVSLLTTFLSFIGVKIIQSFVDSLNKHWTALCILFCIPVAIITIIILGFINKIPLMSLIGISIMSTPYIIINIFCVSIAYIIYKRTIKN